MVFFLFGCYNNNDEPIMITQDDLTPDIIWNNFTSWTEARKVIYTDNDESKEGYLLTNFNLYATEVFGKKYLNTTVDEPYNFTSSYNDEYLRLSGNKLYGLDIHTGKEILFHDFSTWKNGGDITIQNINDEPERIHADSFLELETTKWYSGKKQWKIYGKDGEWNYIRYIGEVNNRGLTNYMSRTRKGVTFENGVVSEKAIILKIEYFGKKVWGVGNNQDPVCFRHPNYKNIMDSIIPFIPKGI